MGKPRKSRREEELEAASYYYNSIISSFEEVLVEYEEAEAYEDCSVIMEVIDDLKKEKQLIEIAELTGRGIKR